MYQSGAVSTAIYPGTLVYPALGLCGEVGELIVALVRDENQGGCGDELESIKKEIGDVLWYVANIAEDMGLLLSEVMGEESFREYTDPWRVNEVTRELPVHAGMVAECVKKTIRDDDGELAHARGAIIIKALSSLVIWMERLCSNYEITLEECARLNLDKLRSRAERGVLKGDGNER